MYIYVYMLSKITSRRLKLELKGPWKEGELTEEEKGRGVSCRK